METRPREAIDLLRHVKVFETLGPRSSPASSRESACRLLAVRERARVVTQGGGRVTVHDPAALERYMS